MGWAYGRNAKGREVGYSVEAECDQDGCTTAIDRGLAYVCGGMHDGGDHGCGGYFCEDHLAWPLDPNPDQLPLISRDEHGDRYPQLCPSCIDKVEVPA